MGENLKKTDNKVYRYLRVYHVILLAPLSTISLVKNRSSFFSHSFMSMNDEHNDEICRMNNHGENIKYLSFFFFFGHKQTQPTVIQFSLSQVICTLTTINESK